METISYIKLRLMVSESVDSGSASEIWDAYISFPPTDPQDVQFQPILGTLAGLLTTSVINWKLELET